MSRRFTEQEHKISVSPKEQGEAGETMQYPLAELEDELLASLEEVIGKEILGEVEIRAVVGKTGAGQVIEGDYGFHCAPLAKQLKQNPAQIASELVAKLSPKKDGLIQRFVAVGSYVNVVINAERFGTLVRNSVLELGSDFGKEKIGTGQKIVIDMSSPNIAKRMSVGHLRSTIIGDSLARIFKHLDYEVIKDNHLGDWGTQFGHLLRAIELWGDEEKISQNPITELQKLYVKISDAGEPDSKLYEGLSPEEATAKAEAVKNEGREWFRRLEQGDPAARAQWLRIVDWSMQEFQAMYDVLGVEFDWARGESFYENLLEGAIEKVKESGIATESKGALVVNMEDANLGVAIVQKSDGATLYLTREIATGVHRAETENADGMIYVVGEDQKLYFQQFFEILHRMGYKIADKSVHVYFGMIRFPEGKMSTRKGRVILLEDVIQEAFDRTRQLVDQRTHVKTEEEREQLIRQVAVGALKWNDLMADPKRTIIFDWDAMLSMEGNSAPYVQYSHARIASLLEGIDVATLRDVKITPTEESEKNVLKITADFPKAVREAAQSYNPSKIAAHVYELAKAFSVFYHNVPILRAEDAAIRLSRLAISATVAQTLRTGLDLLGIEAPENM